MNDDTISGDGTVADGGKDVTLAGRYHIIRQLIVSATNGVDMLGGPRSVAAAGWWGEASRRAASARPEGSPHPIDNPLTLQRTI